MMVNFLHGGQTRLALVDKLDGMNDYLDTQVEEVINNLIDNLNNER